MYVLRWRQSRKEKIRILLNPFTKASSKCSLKLIVTATLSLFTSHSTFSNFEMAALVRMEAGMLSIQSHVAECKFYFTRGSHEKL